MGDKSCGSFAGNGNQPIAAESNRAVPAPVAADVHPELRVGQLPGQSGLELFGRAWDEDQKKVKGL